MSMSRIFSLLGICLIPTTVFAAPFYQENFNFDLTNASQTYDAGTQTHWNAFRSGSRVGVIGFLKVVSGLSRSLPAINSNPTGPDDGYALWSKDVVGLTIYSDEYSFNVASLARVNYLQRVDGVTLDPVVGEIRDGSRLALRIRGIDGVERWYIGDLVVRQVKEATWENVDIDVAALTFGVAKLKPGVGPTLPLTGRTTLPSIGVVTAVGVFYDTVNGRIRVDNFTLSDKLSSNGIVPQAIPTRAATPGAQPTNSEPDTDPDPVVSVPTPTPTATPTSNVVIATPIAYGFCPTSPKGKKLVITGSLRKKLLSSLAKNSQLNYRDRAIVAVAATTAVRLDSLINLRVSDFSSLAGKPYLTVYGSESRPVRLASGATRAITEYIAASALNEPTSPLFRTFTAPNAPSLTATCGPDIVKVVKAALTTAGLSKQVKLTR